MAKKKAQDDVPNPNSVQNRDIMQRLNYLYQASILLGGTQTPSRVPPKPPLPEIEDTARMFLKKKAHREKMMDRHPKTCADLSKNYVKSMKAIGQKTNVRIDPSVKRVLCKHCNIVLVIGTTARVRIHSSGTHGNIVSYMCVSCRTVKRIPAPPQPEEQTAEPSDWTIDTIEDAGEDVSMADDAAPQAGSSSLPAKTTRRPVRRKKQPVPKKPPLFARKDAGHIVFRGNERLPEP